MISSVTALSDRLCRGEIAQKIGPHFIITKTGERVSKRAITAAVKKGLAEAFPADMFGDDLSAWRKPTPPEARP